MNDDTLKLKQLRQETGISFSLCKKALKEGNGDLEKAKKLLEKWGIEKSAGKASRTTNQGSFFSYIHHNGKIGVLLELLCETDFVAANSDFRYLGKELSMQVSFSNPHTAEELLKGSYIKEPEKTVDNLIKEYILKIGENIKVGRYVRYEL